MNRRRAYTLTELMVVVAIASIVFVTAMPDNDAVIEEERRGFTEKFQADLGYARSQTITDPSDPVIVKLSPMTNEYWLARKSTPTTPILHPVIRKPFRVKVGPGTSRFSHVELVGAGFGDEQAIEFASTGSLKDDTTPVVRISVDGDLLDVAVGAVAGTVETVAADTETVVDELGKIVKKLLSPLK